MDLSSASVKTGTPSTLLACSVTRPLCSHLNKVVRSTPSILAASLWLYKVCFCSVLFICSSTKVNCNMLMQLYNKLLHLSTGNAQANSYSFLQQGVAHGRKR